MKILNLKEKEICTRLEREERKSQIKHWFIQCMRWSINADGHEYQSTHFTLIFRCSPLHDPHLGRSPMRFEFHFYDRPSLYREVRYCQPEFADLLFDLIPKELL